ncbi:MAG: hypothetical protein ACYDAE_04410 [Steroidobacteraceae bacterium]
MDVNTPAVADHVIHYKVNDDDQETTEHVLTPRQIMSKAEIDPDQNYLEEIIGGTRKSFKDSPDAQIHMHEHQRFITVYVGPVPVS